MNMNYIGLVCARGGSKGLPGKNAMILRGKSLVGHSVSLAYEINRISTVFVSTDSVEISKLAESEGGQVPFLRPAALSQDDSSEWAVWRHTIEYLTSKSVDMQGLVVLPPTAPLRAIEDVEACLNLYETNQFDIIITVTDSARSPYFNMVKASGNGCAELVIKPDNGIVRRQDVPEVFDMTTVAYVAKPSFVMSANSMFEGRVGYVHIPRERAVDIDTHLDFQIAKWIAERNGN